MSKPRYRWTTAVVTGAASGIGREYCLALARGGCRQLVMVDRAPCGATAELLPEGVTALECRLDLAGADAPATLMAWLDSHGLEPDLLVNNAGIFDFASLQALEPGRIDLYIDLHVRSVTHLTRLMAARMASRGGGNILNMASMACWIPYPGIAMYAATKAYIRVLTRAVRHEVGGRGVRLTVACPGGIATDLFGLPRGLQRLGVRVGALATPHGFVRRALRRTARGRKQYVNGPVNRLAIAALWLLPERARRLVATKLLPRYGRV